MLLQILEDPKVSTFFQYFGLAVFAYKFLSLSQAAINNFFTFFLGLGQYKFKRGSWAVITGCTDGIGKAYAELLAKKGLNVVLLSRSLDKLEKLADEIKTKYSVQTKVIAADFTEVDSIYPNIKSQLENMEITVLVNNVGMSYKHPEFFEALDNKFLNDMITCNITSVNKMTLIVLPIMVKNKQGVIINNASGSGRVPTPLLTVYSATKAYVDFFSRALNIEYKSKGIIVQSLCPYFVSTKLSQVRPNLTAPVPNQFVRESLKTIQTQPVTNGCLIHNIQGWLFENVIPRGYIDSIFFKHLLAARSRALKKLAKQQENKKD